MMLLNYLYSKFSKPYLYNCDNANTYKYNMTIKNKINNIVIISCWTFNILLVAGIIALL